MLTIVEGPDGAGKTTLINYILDHSNARHCHHGAYIGEQNIAPYYMHSLMTAARYVHHGNQFIMDRSWLAEPIYGAAYRNGEDRIGPIRARMLERVALSSGVSVIICLPPYEVCRDNWARRNATGGEYVTREDAFKKIYDGYTELFEKMRYGKHGLFATKYDYTNSVGAALTIPNAPKNKGPGAGAFRKGAILFVGDRINNNVVKTGTTWWPPFVSFSQSGCSYWLAEELEKAGVRERDLYWINATDLSGKQVDPSFIEELGPSAIFALGKDAARWCIEASVPHQAFPHPQYWKRFHATTPYQMTSALKGLVK